MIPAAVHPMVPDLARITRVVREVEGVFTIHLDVSRRPGGFPFAPGQFNMLYVVGVGEVAISISGDPARPGDLVHTVRAVGSVTRAMEALPEGEVIGLRGPYGAPWPLAEAKGRDLVIVAGGLGLAPLRPAIVHALARAHRRSYGRVVILYGARAPSDLLFLDDLDRWRGEPDTAVEVTVDRAELAWAGHVGVVPELFDLARFDASRAVALVCGPEVMMRFTARELQRRGVSPDRVWVSMERNMKCGAGLCGHCQYGPTFVCKDGPVFRLDRIERLLYLREI